MSFLLLCHISDYKWIISVGFAISLEMLWSCVDNLDNSCFPTGVTSVAMNQSIMFTFSTFINKNHVDLMFWNSSFDYCIPIGRHDLSQLHSPSVFTDCPPYYVLILL